MTICSAGFEPKVRTARMLQDGEHRLSCSVERRLTCEVEAPDEIMRHRFRFRGLDPAPLNLDFVAMSTDDFRDEGPAYRHLSPYREAAIEKVRDCAAGAGLAH